MPVAHKRTIMTLYMLGHMTENPESMEMMKKMMGQNMTGSEMMHP